VVDGIVQRPFSNVTLNGTAAPVASSQSTTSSERAALGSVKSGKNCSPWSKKASGIFWRGAVAKARPASTSATPAK
jgi:hypothetical protein